MLLVSMIKDDISIMGDVKMSGRHKGYHYDKFNSVVQWQGANVDPNNNKWYAAIATNIAKTIKKELKNRKLTGEYVVEAEINFNDRKTTQIDIRYMRVMDVDKYNSDIEDWTTIIEKDDGEPE